MEAMDYWSIKTSPDMQTVGGGIYKRMAPSDTPRNYIGVDDIDEAIEKFESAGGKLVHEKAEVPGEGWSNIGKDPEGNLVGIFQAKLEMWTLRSKRSKRSAMIEPRFPVDVTFGRDVP